VNERIRELAEQADPEYWHKRWYSSINPRVMDPEIKKFAELIMRETFDWVVENVGLMEDSEWKSLKKHFGVE
jgi:hypothetical protein